ncbi:sigma-70 family RNA polymerase sigma factor [Streptomyces sp. BE20]|uniref:RNA polymerase sigma factor n=1 Tax=Streptomyces sp. BE20 TaxID=3002525 RepID=UPI002E797B6E|nr:sigma-70 family RNA polymerase sigma factor [Streptomyces sp. BE20]MEE1823519.1 sigma-70 family RNA polymerase sigma factor [Streptomyces sp. BE20]
MTGPEPPAPGPDAPPAVDDLLRCLAPQVVGVLTRRYGDFATAEDAVQEALLDAATQWPDEGVPRNPRGWLVQVAGRRMTEQVRSEQARRRREDLVAGQVPADRQAAPPADAEDGGSRDDTLTLLFLCCHPALSPASAIALTLRSVGGLTTGEIARAFLVPEATMGQRISRAKQRIKSSGVPFRMPEPDAAEWPARLDAVLHVLYLVFNEGYASSTGPALRRVELSREAIRLTRAVHALLPDDAEVAGLLALMLLTEARGPARTRPDGELVPLAEQDRGHWDAAAIAEGVALITAALPRGPVGPYQVQAAIAAVHDEAPTAAATDWPQILALYGVLARISDNPLITLNRAVATAMVDGPAAGLALLAEVPPALTDHHRLYAVRAYLHELAGEREAAVADYRAAARRTASLPERHHLSLRAARAAAGAEPEAGGGAAPVGETPVGEASARDVPAVSADSDRPPETAGGGGGCGP